MPCATHISCGSCRHSWNKANPGRQLCETFCLSYTKRPKKGLGQCLASPVKKKGGSRCAGKPSRSKNDYQRKNSRPNPVKPTNEGVRGKALSLLDRLVKHSDALLAFAEFEAVPFSNNQAERDTRPAKIKQKVAGCFRTAQGANRYARIQGFISTCRKHQVNVFKELRAVCTTSHVYVAPFGS